MSKMFTSYESKAEGVFCQPPFLEKPRNSSKLLTNVKGNVIGVQVDLALPLQLYFHLENICEIELNTLLSGIALFEIFTTTHKLMVSQEFLISDILDQCTNDLAIFLPVDKMKLLKKETYNMKVTLKTATGNFVVFAEKDGYLVVR